MTNTDNIYEVDTVVRWKRTGQMARIVSHTYQHAGQNFLNYLAEIEGRIGTYCVFHDDVEFECGPRDQG